MRVLGLDPGSRYTGYGVVEKTHDQRLIHIASGRINATKGDAFADRLSIIYAGLQELMDEFPCEHASIESVFMHKNSMSAIKLGQARGVVLLAANHGDLSIAEYAPATVKQIVAGNGRAAKADVQTMVKHLLGIQGSMSEDASDALAIAICHCHHIEIESRLLASTS